MLILTGANGALGRLVVEAVLQRIPAERLGVSVRDPSKAADLATRGVRVRQGSFDDAASLRTAFEGATRVLIISSNSAGDAAVQHHRAAIDAAKAAGAQRIFYTSHVGSSATSAFAPMRDHSATETALRDSGVAFTSLRNGFYAASVPMMVRAALATGELRAPADGPVSWTAHTDLAEATATLLCAEGPAESTTVNLTATEAIDMTGIAAIVAAIAGRPVRRIVEPAADYVARLVAHGVPAARAEMLAGIFTASRQGDFARVDPRLEQLLSRAPRSLRQELTTALRP